MVTSLPPSAEICKAMTFSICGHRFALPVSSIVRIIHQSAVQFDELGNGLIFLEQQPIPLLHLHLLLRRGQRDDRRLPSSNSEAGVLSMDGGDSAGEPPSFLVICRLHGVSLSAIPVDEPPTILDLPVNTIQVLPSPYRQSIGGIANHVAILPTPDRSPGSSQPILLLDLQAAMDYRQLPN